MRLLRKFVFFPAALWALVVFATGGSLRAQKAVKLPELTARRVTLDSKTICIGSYSTSQTAFPISKSPKAS